MENRSNTPGKVLKALISKYIYNLEEEEHTADSYFDRITTTPHCRVREQSPEDNDLSCA